MAIPTLSGSYIDETYGRLVQVSGSEYADGFGNPISFGGGPGGAINTIQINSDGTNFTGSANLKFVNNNIQLTGSILMSGSSYISGVDYLQFDTTAVNTAAVGKMYWNDVDGTLELGLKGGTVRSELGQGLVTRVVNKTSPLVDLAASNYQVVVVGGAQGQRLSVRLAKADNDANSAGTLGIVAEDIARNQEGFVITVGLLKNRDTTGALQGETWNDGDILYLSPFTAGAITNIKPQAPNHTVIVGYVEYAHQNNGKIYVKIDNGYEIDELHNVKINGVTSGDLLMYSSSVWINSKSLSGSYSITGSLTISGSSTFTNKGPAIFSGSVTSTGGFTGSLQGTASFASTASTADNFNVRGNLIVSGNTTIGDATTDSITMSAATMSLGNGTGILNIDSNTLYVDGNANRVGVGKIPTTTFEVNGSSLISGSLNVTTGITASLQGTASWANNSITASFASLASNIQGGEAKSIPLFDTTTRLTTSFLTQANDILKTVFNTTDVGINLDFANGVYSLGQIAGTQIIVNPNTDYVGVFDQGAVGVRIEGGSTRVVTLGDAWGNAGTNTKVTIDATNDTVQITGTFTVQNGAEFLSNVTMALGNYGDDTEAAAGGVPINGLYRKDNVVQIRVS